MILLPPLARVVHAGVFAAAVSTAAAAALSRIESGRATAAMNAVSHMVRGGKPPAEPGPYACNFALGTLLHFGANLFWAAVFERVFGRAARRSVAAAWSSGLAIAVLRYIVDYAIVPRRLRRGMDAYLSGHSLLAVYVGLACGYGWSALRIGRCAVYRWRRGGPAALPAVLPAPAVRRNVPIARV